LSGQTTALEVERFKAEVAWHKTHAQPESAFQLSDWKRALTRAESVSSATADTRSSFMATWKRVSGAKGYMLDASTSSAFDSYLDGYRALDVGDVTGRLVTGLKQGATY
jgi:hypothetical protein